MIRNKDDAENIKELIKDKREQLEYRRVQVEQLEYALKHLEREVDEYYGIERFGR